MDASREPAQPQQADTVALLWLIGALLVLSGPVVYWSTLPIFDLVIPRDPVAHVNPVYSRQLALIERANAVIPPKASYTAVAADPDDEMSLFMLSLGPLRERRALPTRYFGELREVGKDARYVISDQCAVLEADARLVGAFREGCVYERSGSP